MQAVFHNETANNLIMNNTKKTNNYSNKSINIIELKLTKYSSETMNMNINIIMDVDELKDMYYNGRLKGAHVFAYLFGIDVDIPFRKNDLLTEVNLDYFYITHHDWLELYGFLRNGYVTPLVEQRMQKINIEKCYETTLKLGGIPAFDVYYKECIQKLS